jgi:Calcium binding
MIEEAIVDAHDGPEQATGWYTIFEQHLDLPFETRVLGVSVTVTRIHLGDDDRITAICTRGGHSLAVGLADLPLPSSGPEGSGWIEAYRLWVKGR